MPRIPVSLATALLAGCAGRGGMDPSAIAAAGTELANAPTPGQPFATQLISIDGEDIAVPDPSGRAVVLELIRSADW
mgnify:CR=1 FL=1